MGASFGNSPGTKQKASLKYRTIRTARATRGEIRLFASTYYRDCGKRSLPSAPLSQVHHRHSGPRARRDTGGIGQRRREGGGGGGSLFFLLSLLPLSCPPAAHLARKPSVSLSTRGPGVHKREAHAIIVTGSHKISTSAEPMDGVAWRGVAAWRSVAKASLQLHCRQPLAKSPLSFPVYKTRAS